MEILFKSSNTGGNKAQVQHTNFAEHYASVNPGIAWSRFEPTIRKVTEKWLIPYIGQALYDDLVTDFQAGEVDPGVQSKILELCQDVVALFTMVELGPEFNISFAPQGIVEKQSNNAPTSPVSQWRYHEWKYETTKNADQALDALILKLDAYAKAGNAYVDLWKDAAAYQQLRTSFFTSAGEYHRYIKINNSRRMFEAFVPQIELAEEEVKSIIGAEQFTHLIETLADDDLNDIEKELLDKIRKYVACKSASASASSLFLNIDSHGLTLSSFSDTMSTHNHHASSFKGAEAVSRYIVDIRAQSEVHWRVLTSFIYDNIDDFELIQDSDAYKSYTSESTYPICTGDGGVML